MAPPKKESEREARLSTREQADLVLHYLRKTNRPYSATDISQNLKNKVSKAGAQKLLKDMHERKEIEGRAAGKQLVYHALQPELEEDMLEQFQDMDQENSRLREQTIALKSEEKQLRIVLKGENTLVPLPQLKGDISGLQAQKATIETRLATLRSGNLQPMSVVENGKVTKMHREVKRSLEARKKIRFELWKIVEELVGKDKSAETKDALGLEF